MPRVTFRGQTTAYADGAGNYTALIDISTLLSGHYGKLIRQGNSFKIKQAGIRVFNPNTAVQDRLLTASGRLVYYSPTHNRKKAWKNAFSAVQRLRRMVGLKEKNYDFRVGLVSSFGDVLQQAWIRSEDDVLTLGDSGQNGIFDVHNAQIDESLLPKDPNLNGFGFPFDVAGLGVGDADFKEGLGDGGYFKEGQASATMESIPFMAAMAGSWDNAGEDDFVGATNAEHIPLDDNVMCGLIGVMLDTTVPDDTELQIEDVGLEITLDIESWSSLLPKRRRKKK